MDLHLHSIYSDGELTPEELLEQARERNISIISITDHDAIAGYFHGREKAKQLGIELIPGIELNTEGPEGELHILGYHFDATHSQLAQHIHWREQERKEWAKAIVHHLQSLGYRIQWEQCLKRVRGNVIVRSHIAEELVSLKYFSTVIEAYEQLLKKGTKGYLPRAEFSARKAIELIHGIGGVAFLAHPGIYHFPVQMERLVSYGLDGIEVYHSKHHPKDRKFWAQEAFRYGLKQSGGSDYHGPHSRNPYPIGSVEIPESICRQWQLAMEV